jgi:CRISPR-associated endonuclease Csn1
MKQIPYVLGLDIGITSVGWAVIQNDIHGEPIKIERLGVRIFDGAEQPKTGASLALPRRQARGARRIVRRRRHRKERIKKLICDSGILSSEEIELLFECGKFDEDVYSLRVSALDRLLTKEELVRLLIHFAQRRGYKSNSRSEEAKEEKETGKVKQAISANKQRMLEHGYRTVGEMLWKDELFHRVNPDGSVILAVHNTQEEYKTTVERSMLEEELRLIFSKQREFGSVWTTEAFEEQYIAIWGSQRNFDEGPGGNSKYGGAQIEKMLGKCTFEEEELRAPKASYTAEYFRLMQTVNNMKIVGHGMPAEFLSEEQRKIFVQAAMASPSLTYTQLRKKLGIAEDYFFNGLFYGDKTAVQVEKKELKLMPFYHELRKALNKVEKNAIAQLSQEQMDEIARIITLYKSDDNRVTKLKERGIPEKFYPALLELSASKASHLSLKAMRKLLPYLEQGETYDKACKAVYGNHDGRCGDTQRKQRLSVMDAGEINNPVVLRAVSQSVKVINAIVREYGAPEIVRVELAREMGKNLDMRNQMKNRQTKNAERNEALRKQIEEIKHDTPTGQDIVKLKLFQEQNGVCLYSGKNLDVSRLFEAGYVDVDHIIPYSISFDDSYNNKVLVLASENRQKGNRIPYEYMGQDVQKWHQFETLVGTQIRSYKKRKNLLARSIPNQDDFKRRNLVDTQYISRVVYNLINDHLEFAETGNYKKKTQTVNGAITAQIRKRLGIDKIRENGDLHHAADAAVIACVSPGMVQKITNYSKRCECAFTRAGYVDYETGEVMTKEAYDEKYAPKFPAPWTMFRKELEARLSDNPRAEIDLLKLATYENDEEIKPVFVSRMPNHKVTGAAHLETIRSGKKQGGTVTKTALSKLKLDKKTGEIVGYYNRESDELLYQALKAQLEKFGGDGEKAFTQPFYKPKHDGTPGPLVKKVKIFEKATLTVPTNQKKGVAANGSMIRVDVFHVEKDGYYFVPVYVSDTVAKELPNRAVVANKPYEQWKPMKESDFLFSLCAGDLIRICNNKPIKLKQAEGGTGNPELLKKEGLYYYNGLNISSGALHIQLHDRSYSQSSLGGKRLGLIEKYEVDILGNYRPVKLPEQRQRFKR